MKMKWIKMLEWFKCLLLTLAKWFKIFSHILQDVRDEIQNGKDDTNNKNTLANDDRTTFTDTSVTEIDVSSLTPRRFHGKHKRVQKFKNFSNKYRNNNNIRKDN